MSEQLSTMIIPFQENRSALLPKELIEYILPYAPPLPSSYSHDALVGALIYRNEKVPVLDLSVMFTGEPNPMKDIDGRRRIVIVSCLNRTEEFSSFALLATEAPSMVEITSQDIATIESTVPHLFYSQVSLARHKIENALYIPDMHRIEAELFN